MLSKPLNILKWISLTLIFWLALALLLIKVAPAYSTWVIVLALLGWLAGWLYTFKKAKHKSWFFLAFFLPITALYITLHFTPVQNWLVSTVTQKLSTNLKAKVSIRHIDYSFFDKMDLNGLLVEDQQKDTLLYAGSVKVSISDWFFFKEKATLHYVALSDAVVNMHRTDSVWNYQFLVDYFSSPNKDTSKKKSIEIDLKRLHLTNVRFNSLDRWVGRDMTVSIKGLDLDANNINLSKKKIDLNGLALDAPHYRQYDYDGNRDKLHLPKDTSQRVMAATAYQWNNAGWVLHVKNIHLTDGIFNNEQQTERPAFKDHFDGAHLSFEQINGDLNQVHFEHDTLTTQLNLATREHSGFEVKKIAAAFKFTPEIMEFKGLHLQTNKSVLGNYYAMRFRHFSADMNDFIHQVTMEGHFINSQLNSDDLAFFAPEVKQWKRIFSLSGWAKGKVDNIATKKMIIQTGNSRVDGDIALKGLPDIDHTFIDFKANELQTTMAEISSIVPSIKNIGQPNLAKLGKINYRGNFTGFLNDFVAYGTIKTNLGVVNGDLNMKLPIDQTTIYTGKIATQGFNLGAFINTPQLGNIVFNGQINGSGFSAQTMKANFDGQIKSLFAVGYNYQNITVKGDFSKNLFNGTAQVNDPNLQLRSLNGSIDFSGLQPIFKVDADLAKADFKPLKLIADDYVLNGQFKLNFTGSNIDNFLGSAKIYDAVLLHQGKPLIMDSLVLQSSLDNSIKTLSLQSNNVDALVKGQFTIQELPNAFKAFLSRYYPAYIEKPSSKISNEDFTFSVKTKQVDAYMQLLDKNLSGFNDASLEGKLQLKNNLFDLDAQVPQFSYKGSSFNNIRLHGNGNLDTLVAKMEVDDIAINDSLHLPSTNLAFTSHNDLTNISLQTSAGKTLSEAAINAQLQTMRDGIKVHFFPSSFIINEKKWQLEKDGELVFSNEQVNASAVKFLQGNQEIDIATQPSEIGNSNDLVISLKKVSIDDLLPMVLKNPRLEGLLTGTVKVSDPFKKPFIEYDTQAEKFTLDGDSIGVINAKGTYSANTGVVQFNVAADNPDNDFALDGNYNIKDSTSNQANINLIAKKLDLKILNSYLNGIFSDIAGFANTSDLKITGNAKKLSITGTANILEGSLNVLYTQCRYHFKNESIIFNPDEIDFGSIQLIDSLRHTATLSGKMYHHFFNDISFDNIKLETEKMLVLNTTKKDNTQFYGKVIGKANLVLNGPIDNMTMNISGEPSTTDSSHIYLLSNSSVESAKIDYIDFIEFGSKMKDAAKTKSAVNIVVNLALTANPACKIDVILDETTGDIIKGQGNGLLKIRVGNKEPLTIDGRYDISKGEYTFNFQTFLKKYFTVNSGSIVWTGDPYKAQMDVIAEYLASNVDFSNIAANLSTGTNNAKSFNQKGDLRVLAHLTETLLKPAIDFEFKLPTNSPLSSDFFIVKRLQQFQEDKNDLNKQVTSLLLFNSFINSSQGFLTASSGYNVLSSTIGGVVSNAISGFFNKFLQKYIKNTSLYFDLNTTYGVSATDLQTNVAQLQAAAKSGFIVTLLKGRLIVSAGLNLDYNNPYINYAKTNNNVLVTPDITAEFIIKKDGSIRVVGFNRTNYDLIGQRNKSGFNLSYRKDFDQFWQLF